MTPVAANDAPEFEIARLAGLLAQEAGADYAIRLLGNVSKALEPMREPPIFRACRMAMIAREVAEKYGLKVSDLTGPRRAQPIARARQEAFARCYALRGPGRDDPVSMPSIGRFFGGRDHTTVLHGIRAHDARQAGAE